MKKTAFLMAIMAVCCVLGSLYMRSNREAGNENSEPIVNYVERFEESDDTAESFGDEEDLIKEFWAVRNKILQASQKHGLTGPEDDSPVYWIVEDFYYPRTQVMEVYDPEGWNSKWLSSIMRAMADYPEWKLMVSGIKDGGMVIRNGEVTVSGPLFLGCKNLESVLSAAKLVLQNDKQRKAESLESKLSYIRSCLKHAMKETDRNGFYYLATFPGSDTEKTTVWILQRNNSDEAKLEKGYAGSDRPVTGDGTILGLFDRNFWPYTDVCPAYWLVEVRFDGPAKEMTVDLVDQDGKKISTVVMDNIVQPEG